jgi:NADPH-dependent 2,4-dienoyl-CoA reductase/sulfur reductase-like enzyme
MTARSSVRTVCEVAIVGAGPHGLSTAAYLRAAGIEARVFGEVMGFWRSMPVGMVLRSERPGSHIPDPNRALTLDRYEDVIGRKLARRVPLDDFVAYGLWYQRDTVPEIDSRRVAQVATEGNRFRLTLDDGETVHAKRVVMATGLTGFAARPPAFAQVPMELAPHSSELRNPADFAGLRVAVVGAGQSALESAALLHEAGADVDILARRPEIRFLSGRNRLRDTPLHSLIYPPGEVGPPGFNWIIELPALFSSLPLGLQQFVARQVAPVGSAWLRPRLANVRSTAGRSVAAATETAGGLQLTLDDGSKREVDRAVLGTGYRVDLDRHPVLAPSLIASLRRMNGAPRLGAGLESSVPGLHFVGAAASASFGPLMRFVAGAGYAARAVSRRVKASMAKS